MICCHGRMFRANGLTYSEKCTANTGPLQIAYLLLMWGGIWSGVVFLWRRLICPQDSSLRMFWYKDLNSSHFFLRFGALEHEANRTPDISATFIGSRKKFCKRNRMSVCPAREPKPSISSLSYRSNHFNQCSRCKNYATSNFVSKYGPHVVPVYRSTVAISLNVCFFVYQECLRVGYQYLRYSTKASVYLPAYLSACLFSASLCSFTYKTARFIPLYLTNSIRIIVFQTHNNCLLNCLFNREKKFLIKKQNQKIIKKSSKHLLEKIKKTKTMSIQKILFFVFFSRFFGFFLVNNSSSFLLLPMISF